MASVAGRERAGDKTAVAVDPVKEAEERQLVLSSF